MSSVGALFRCRLSVPSVGAVCQCRLSAVIFIVCTEVFYNEHKLRPANYVMVAYSLMYRTGISDAPHTAATSPTPVHA